MNQKLEASAPQPTLADLFNMAYGAHGKSATLDQIFQKAFQGEAPDKEVAAYSFVSKTDLNRIAQALHLQKDQTFADLGCGCGGPGLWMARKTGAFLVGIDPSDVAVQKAAERADLFQQQGRARFQVGDFSKTGLDDSSLDGAMSIDALWLAEDKQAALAEVARILKAGARFVFTTWDSEKSMPGLPPQVRDHRPLLENAGLEIEIYEETQNWKQHQQDVYTGLLQSEPVLFQEMGEAAGILLHEARLVTGLLDGVDYLAQAKRVLIAARKK